MYLTTSALFLRNSAGKNLNNSGIELKSEEEIEKLRIAGQMTARVLRDLSKSVKAGVTTGELDNLARNQIASLGSKPAFLGYRGYPASACISINNELVHGIPNPGRVINEGDIVSIDLGIINEGYYGDCALTVAVGKISEAAKKLIKVTEESLYLAIDNARPGKRMGDLAYAIQSYAEKNGFSVVRDYVGHGIGRALHEEPPVPNFGAPGTGIRFVPGMVFAIEPMINQGSWQVKTLPDGWTVVTADGKLCAHFEHMVAITEMGCEILTLA